MKNKIILQQKLELVEQLLEAVNSKEEFEQLQSEKAQLLNFYTDERRCRE